MATTKAKTKTKAKANKRQHRSRWIIRFLQRLRGGLRVFQRAWPIRFLSRCLSAPFRWLGVWIRSRSWRYLLQGSPALLAVGFIACVLFAQTIKAPITDIQRYSNAILEAIDEEEWETADLWLRKLVQMGVDDNETKFRAALVASELNRPQRTLQLMRELAPDALEGYPEAHFWIAVEKRTWSRSELDVLIHHLEVATRSRFSVLAHYELARAYNSNKQYKEALEKLKFVVTFKPDARFDMVDLHQRLGQTAEAKRQLEIAERVFRVKVEFDPSDVESRLWWAKAYSMQGQFANAERVIGAGIDESQDPRLVSALAEVYAMTAYQLRSAGDEKMSVLLGLLQRSLAYVPDSPLAIKELVQFFPGAGESEPPADLLDALADGNSAAVVHLILAGYSLNGRQLEPAELHLERAYGLNSKMSQVLNSLSVRLANLDPNRREQALLLVTLALRAKPKNLEVRATRGQILALMGKWDAARVDLEAALAEFDDHAGLHAALAKVYEQLGQPAKAKLHFDRAQQLGRKSSQNALERYGE